MRHYMIKSYISYFYRLVLLVGMTVPGTAYSLDNNPSQCTGPLIKSLNIGVRDSSSERISLKYQYVRKAFTGFPTVVYMPGGPGGASIGDQSISSFIPDSFGLIQTDPRGAGCNTSRKLKMADLSTPILAKDILTIIDTEKIPGNEVILMGKSYGTALATTVAYLNSQNGREPFQKIVLEGVLGHSSQNQNDYLSGYVAAGKKYFNQRQGLADRVESVIVKNNVDRKVFARFFAAYLFEGNTGKAQEHPLDQPLQWMTDGLNFKVFLDFLTPFQKENQTEDVSGFLWLAITCHELVPLNFDFTFKDGLLNIEKASTGNSLTCKNTNIDRPYDAQKLQLREDIVYLEGSDDPATPLSQALYHFASQKNAKAKSFILFNGFGHSVLAWIEYRHPGLVKQIWSHNFDPNFIKASLPEFQIDFK
jgi:pimeloyl-ACP methyl ester carboxylesterase